MPARVSPTDRIRAEIDALFDGSRELAEIIEDVARLGARLIIQTAVEAEVDAFLGRARYKQVADCPDARPGSRNGYCDSTVKTTAGPVTIERPKLRGTTEAFASQLFGKGVTKSNALEHREVTCAESEQRRVVTSSPLTQAIEGLTAQHQVRDHQTDRDRRRQLQAGIIVGQDVGQQRGQPEPVQHLVHDRQPTQRPRDQRELVAVIVVTTHRDTTPRSGLRSAQHTQPKGTTRGRRSSRCRRNQSQLGRAPPST